MSKKALAKAAKKDAKAQAKAGNAPPAKAGGKPDGKKKGAAAADAPAPAKKAAAAGSFSGPAADLWETLLKDFQWFGGVKQSQADAQAVQHVRGKAIDAERYPNLYFWASMATKFSDEAMKKWPAGEL